MNTVTWLEESLHEIEEHRQSNLFVRQKNNAYPTMSLVLEPAKLIGADETSIKPIFTFKEDDYFYSGKMFENKKYISLRRLYLEIADLTEYIFAKTIFGNFDHWKCFFMSIDTDEVGRYTEPYKWFKDVVAWRGELELALRAKGLQSIVDKSSNSANAKWLVDRGWTTEGQLMGTTSGVRKRGRPSKAEVSTRASILSRVSSDKNKVLQLRTGREGAE